MFQATISLPSGLLDAILTAAEEMGCSVSEAISHLVQCGLKSRKEDRKRAEELKEKRLTSLLVNQWHLSRKEAERLLAEVERMTLAEIQRQM
ncbi:MAG: hypothetical protein HYY99_00660 [Candidatus Colwellbacteria bacterium]|nr:hypothetical protein [Candidatus Colwellbacteria bacterium]